MGQQITTNTEVQLTHRVLKLEKALKEIINYNKSLKSYSAIISNMQGIASKALQEDTPCNHHYEPVGGAYDQNGQFICKNCGDRI